MQLVKQFYSKCVRVLPLVCGSLLIVAVIASRAHANGDEFDIDTVPEIDPGMLTGAMTLLTGSILVLTGKRWGK